MKLFAKWFLIGVGIFLSVFIIGGYLIPAKWTVSRSMLIKAPVENIHAYVSNLKKWQEWTPWTTEKDSSLKYNYEGPESGVGAKSLWTSDKMGSGSITIKESDPAKGINYDLFIDMGSMQSNLFGEIAYRPEAEGIEVTWTDRGDSEKNLMKRWMSLFMDSMLGKELTSGLEKLKALVEK